MLAEQQTETVIIQADIEAKHGKVMKVMDQIKAAGIDKIVVAGKK